MKKLKQSVNRRLLPYNFPMSYYTENEALDAGPRFFPIGAHWIKQVGDRRMELKVNEDGTFTEWLEGQPHNTWQGRWQTSSIWETPFYIPTVQLIVGDYEARLRAINEASPSGYEIHRPTFNALPFDIKRHEYFYQPRFPKVTLTRIS
jgi:hypothetical protein